MQPKADHFRFIHLFLRVSNLVPLVIKLENLEYAVLKRQEIVLVR